MKEQIINNILHFLSGKIPDEEISELRLQLYYQLADYQVTKKCTDIATTPDKTNMDYLIMYLASLRMSGRSEKTLAHYRLQLSLMLNSVQKPIQDITTDDLFTYLAIYKNRRQVGNRYLDGKRVIFNGFFSWMQKKKHIVYNPASGLDRIKYEKRIKQPLSDEEREVLRCACEKERDLAIIETLYSTGMRVGELVRLNRQDINFSSMDCIVFGKGAKERTVYLNGSSCHHLKTYLLSRTDNNPALFVSGKAPHQRLTEHGIWQLLKRLGQRAGVADVHPHRYRHTTLTNAINRGMPVQEAQIIAGHEDINTTMIYCAISTDNVRASHRKYLSA